VKRGADVPRAKTLVDEALEILSSEDDPVAHFDALTVRAMVASWEAAEEDYVRFMERAYVVALDAGRKDMQTLAAQALAQAHIIRLELDEAELLLTRALELAGESGSVRARVSATLAYGWFLTVKGELDAAETVLEEVRTSAAELGVEPAIAASLMKLGWIARLKGDHKRAEKLLREALRMTTLRGDRGMVPDYQAALAATLVDLGKVDEAERLAVEAVANGSPDDTACKIAATLALAAVRAAQGRDGEANELFQATLSLSGDDHRFKVFEIEPLERYGAFLRDRGRADEAAAFEDRLEELSAIRLSAGGERRASSPSSA
jgi:tetratricopeptide (TPR) repeat protein